MLPTLSGIRELLKVMRSDVFFHDTYSDVWTQSGIQYNDENDFVNPNPCESFIPTSDSGHGSPEKLISHIEMTAPKRTYTTLTSRTKLASTKPAPDVINTDTHHGSSLSTDVEKTIPRPANTVLQNTTAFTRAIPNIDKNLNTEPNVLSMNPRACNPDRRAKFQNILPKPAHTVIISNTAKPEPNTAFPTLYHLLKPNISITCRPMTTVTQPPKSLNVVPVLNPKIKPAIPKPRPTSYIQIYPVLNANNASTVTKISTSFPVYAVSTSITNIANCVIEGQDCSSQTELKSTQPVSTLKSSSCVTLKLRSTIQQSSFQPVIKVFSAKSPENSSSSKSTSEPVLKLEKSRITRKPSSKQVSICLPQTGECDGDLSDVKVELAREELWKLFHEEGNEMIVSKHGRPMFPTLDLKVSGFCPDEMYSVAVKFVCVDKYRYYFDTSRETWDQTRQIHTADHSKCFEHPESPASGKMWNEKMLAFSELRLANRSTNVKNMVFAPTMRKHCAQVVVTMLRCSRCQAKHTRHIDIPLTEFISVSSYYSLRISQLKIALNPMAKMRIATYPRKRKNRNGKSAENVPPNHAKKQKSDSDPVDHLASSFHEITPISSSESIKATVPDNQTSSTTTSTPVSTVSDLATSSILRSASSSQASAITPPCVFHSTTASTSISHLPIISGQATVSRSAIKPATVISTTKPPENRNTLSQTMAPSEYSNNVLSCQTTKSKAHIQSDEDLHEYIKTYLSPFQTSDKDEAFDSSIFDELSNINCISDKLNSFDA